MKQIIIKLVIGFTITGLFLFGYNYTDIGQMLEAKLYDQRFELRGPREPDKNIIILAIDSVSMDELDTWPWPRSNHAEIVKLLKSYGAKAVGFDVVFDKLSREAEKDKIFAQEIKNAGNVALASMLTGGVYSKVSSGSSNLEEALSITAPDPYEEMLSGKITYGLANFHRDLDGNVRWGQLLHPLNDLMPTTQSVNEKWEPTLALQVLKLYDPNREKEIQDKYSDTPFLINFAGPAKTYKTISFSNVLKNIKLEMGDSGKPLEYTEVFKDKIVLIGATAEIFHDTIGAPFPRTASGIQQLMPGVEVHAATIDTVLNGIEYYRASPLINNIIIVVFALIAIGIFTFLNPFFGLGAFILVGLFYTVINIVLFINNNYWIDLGAPIVGMLFVFAGVYSYRFFIEEKEKRRVRSVFKRYMSPALVEEALKDPTKVPSLDICTKKFISVLFSDIAGFTTMSEKFPPEEVKRVLDEYLTAMTGLVFDNGGVLDKYIGDAVMAVYGNIGNTDVKDDAFRVVKTALEMQERMKELRQKWVAEGSIAMQIRIGIHSGEALVGNFGSPLKMDYTVIGDTVNTASRLEGLNKDFGSSIMISQATYELINDKVNVRSLGPAPVKGKSEALHVYEVLGLTKEGEESKLVEERNSKQTRWMRGGGKETKWARGSKDTTWK